MIFLKKLYSHINFKYLFFFLVILIFFLAAIVLRTDYLKISSVSIEASELTCTNPDQIKQQANLLGKNFFLTNGQELESKLKKQYLCLDKISITKKFPNKVVIDVKNRLPAALISVIKQKPNLELDLNEATPSSQTALLDFKIPPEIGRYLVDKNGVIYATSEVQNIGVPPFFYLVDNSVYVGRIIDKDGLSNVISILNKLNEWQISLISVKDDQDKLLIDGQPKIVFSLKKDVKEQLASLQLILETAKMNSNYINLVDLRFNKPIVIYAPKK
jgi:hypothetical protein